MKSCNLIESYILESKSNWAILHSEVAGGEVISAQSAKHALIKSFNSGYLSEPPWRDDDEEDPYMASGLDRKQLNLKTSRQGEHYVTTFGGRKTKYGMVPAWNESSPVMKLVDTYDTIYVYPTDHKIGGFQA